MDTAIRTIAERGYAATSFAEIAREAGISKGVISYHFAGKGDLIQAILARLLKEPAEFIKPRVDAQSSCLEKLKAYVAANFELMRTHRNHYVALVDLWGSRDASSAHNPFDAQAYAPSRRYLTKILMQGQSTGELRGPVSPALASVIQAAIDGVMIQWVFDPNAVDLDEASKQISEMVHQYLIPTGADLQEMEGRAS